MPQSPDGQFLPILTPQPCLAINVVEYLARMRLLQDENKCCIFFNVKKTVKLQHSLGGPWANHALNQAR